MVVKSHSLSPGRSANLLGMSIFLRGFSSPLSSLSKEMAIVLSLIKDESDTCFAFLHLGPSLALISLPDRKVQVLGVGGSGCWLELPFSVPT